MNLTDEQLRAAYRELLARRAAADEPRPATLEEIDDLACHGADTPERVVLLDRVLADPRTRDEYRLLREVLHQPAAAAKIPRPRWGLAAAAVAVIAIGSGVLMRAGRITGPEPVRGDRDALELVTPRPGEAFDPRVPFVWHAVPGALGYDLEVLDESGDVLASVSTTDTTAVPGTSIDPARATGARWTVTARLPAGGTRRSEARPLGG